MGVGEAYPTGDHRALLSSVSCQAFFLFVASAHSASNTALLISSLVPSFCEFRFRARYKQLCGCDAGEEQAEAFPGRTSAAAAP
jgi:hypothetical protein